MPKKLNIKVDLDAQKLKEKMNIKDGYTPIKGVDYFDGKDAVVNDSVIALEASKLALEEIKPSIPTVEQVSEEVTKSPDKIRDSLETLSGDERLDKDYIRGLDDYDEVSKLARQPKVEKIYSTGGGAKVFTNLLDVPNSYTGQAGKYPVVNAGETALEFGTIAPTTPGGSNTQVQFNDSGAFGGDTNFIWDKTNDRLGIQVSAPQVPLHVTSVTGTTLTDVTIGSASLVAEVLPTAPTGTITAIAEPAAGAGGTVNFVDPGTGSFTANGTSYYFNIYPLLDAGGGTYYRSQYYEQVSGTDPGDFQGYNIAVSWGSVTIGSEAVAYYVEYSTDGFSFSTQGIYSTTGETFSSLGGSGSATAWVTSYVNSTGSPVQYDFAPYGYTTTPSLIFSTVGTTYSVTIPSDSINYMFKHTFSGGSPTWKILAPQASPGYGKSLSATYYDLGYVTWSDGTVVTPTSYGFSGTDQNRDYKIYSSGSSIFAVTPLTVSTVAGSGSKSVSLSWTLPAGITQVKILRQVNGGGYTVSKTVNGSSTTDDSTDTSWNGTTVVTPTSYIGGTARFDKSLTSLTGEAQLAIVDVTGSGTRYSKISFGYAADSSSAPTYQAHISTASNAGYLEISSSRINITSTQGGTPTAILGSAYVFNSGQSSSIHFNVKGLNDASLINTRSDRDTVGFGQAIGTDYSTTVQIQPARSTDLALILIGHSSQTATTELFRTQTSGASPGGAITVGGYFLAGAGTASNPSHSFRADPNTGFYNVSADVIGVTVGGTEKERRNATGRYFGGGVAATDLIHLAAGSTSIAPLRFTTGSLTTGANIRSGQMQFLTDKWYGTITTGTAVKEFALNDIALTSGRVPFATTNGRLTDLSTFTYSVNRLSPTYITLGAGTATAGTSPLKFTAGTSLTTPETGAMEFDGKRFFVTDVDKRRGIVESDDTIVTPVTVANTLTETTIYTSTKGANTLSVKDVFEVVGRGKYSTVNASDRFTLRVKIGGTTVASAQSVAANVTDAPIHYDSTMTIRTIGASGTVSGFVAFDLNNTSSDGFTSSTAINTTTSNAITVTIQWDTANAGNTFTLDQGYMKLAGS